MTAIAMMLLNANSLPGVNQMRMVDIIKTCHMILMFVCIETHAPVAMIVVQVVPMQASFEFTDVRIGSKLQSYDFAKYIFGLKVTKNARNVKFVTKKCQIQ